MYSRKEIIKVKNKTLLYNDKTLKELKTDEVNSARFICDIYNNYDILIDYIAIQHKFKANIKNIDNIIVILLLLYHISLEILKYTNIKKLLSSIFKEQYKFNISNKDINDSHYNCKHFIIADIKNNCIISRFRIKDSYLKEIMFKIIDNCILDIHKRDYFKSFFSF